MIHLSLCFCSAAEGSKIHYCLCPMLLDLDVVWLDWSLCWGLPVSSLRLQMNINKYPMSHFGSPHRSIKWTSYHMPKSPFWIKLWGIGICTQMTNEEILRESRRIIWSVFPFCWLLFQWVLKGLWLISRLRGSWYLLRWKMENWVVSSDWLILGHITSLADHWYISVALVTTGAAR